MENIKEQLEEVIKKNFPEKRELKECGKCNACEMMMACEVLYADRQFNQAISQIDASLIADEVLKVVVETRVEIIKKLQEIRREILKNDPYIANQLENIIIELNK